MMLLQRWLVVVVISLVIGSSTVAAVDHGMQSKECAFTKSKPNSCLYFVMKETLNHEEASKFCFNQLNGALVPIYEKYDEAIEVMKRYFWWAYSKMNVPRLRFGMYNDHATVFTYTEFNPTEFNKVDIDMEIWKRSFRNRTNTTPVTLDLNKYDHENFRFDDTKTSIIANETWQYLAVTPHNHKWSNANFNRKIPFICEVPRFPKAYCEPGWWLHMKSRSCFYLNKEELEFQKAAMACRAKGSNLASINDETENNMALKMIQQENGYENKKVWFGLRHDASKAYMAENAPEDKKSLQYAEFFVKNLGYNVDGTPVAIYNYFGQNQPDGFMNSYKENCFLIEQKNTAIETHQPWHDYPCETKGWSLCRKMSSSEPYL